MLAFDIFGFATSAAGLTSALVVTLPLESLAIAASPEPFCGAIDFAISLTVMLILDNMSIVFCTILI